MKKKKIQGHRRRWKHVERWRNDNLDFDLNNYLLNFRSLCNSKIRVHPWSGLTITNSEIPQPRGRTKQKMLTALINIYENWKEKLDKLNQPYYLKIWLFEPRFSQSQVVCAIGDEIDFYKHTFFEPEKSKAISFANYGKLESKLQHFSWQHRLNEDQYDNSFVGEPKHFVTLKDYEENKVWFENLLKKPHRTEVLSPPIGEITEVYFFKEGNVWLGEMK